MSLRSGNNRGGLNQRVSAFTLIEMVISGAVAALIISAGGTCA